MRTECCTKIKANPNFIHRKIAGKDILVAIGEGVADFRGYIQLNDTAVFLWKQLQEEKTQDQIVEAFVHAYSVDKEIAQQDISRCIKMLIEKGLIINV